MTGLGSFLLLLSVSSSGLAWTFFQNDGSLDNPTPVYPYPRIILMGPSGVGKSTLANILAGCLPNDNSCFKTCPGIQSCTNETTLNVVTYLGDDAFGTFTLVDTPGFGDTGEGGDGPIITNIIDVLKHSLGDANMILLCLDYSQRFGPTIQNMITELESLFGRQQVWDHVSIEVTKWHFSENDIMNRNISGVNEDFALDEINEQIKKISHLNKTLSGVFIDSYAPMYPDDESQQEYYQKYTQDLWDMAVAMPLLEFLSIEDILEELSECRAVNDCLNEVLEGRLAQVEADVIEVRNIADHNSDKISTVDATVMINKAQISNNADMINENGDNIDVHSDAIRDNSDAIREHSVAIGDHSDAISNNLVNIQANIVNIHANTDLINLNTGAIDALEHTPVVGVCGYCLKKFGPGIITYERLSSDTSTDGSTINTGTGKYKASTNGLYTITFSAYTYGTDAAIYLYKDGVKQDDSLYFSHQEGADADQGSKTIILCLRQGQEIHLEAAGTASDIWFLQFCIMLESDKANC